MMNLILKLVFQSLEECCYGSQILLVSVHGCHWAQAASGAAGRANVGLYPASSYVMLSCGRFRALCRLKVASLN